MELAEDLIWLYAIVGVIAITFCLKNSDDVREWIAAGVLFLMAVTLWPIVLVMEIVRYRRRGRA